MYWNKSLYAGLEIKYSIADKVILFFYASYFILNPFYFWSSGLPQIADIVFVLSMLTYCINSKGRIVLNKNDKKILVVGFLFVVWIFLVNSIWVLNLQEIDRFLISSLFYLYNYLILFYTLVLYHKYGSKIIQITYISILTSLFVQLIIYLVQGSFSGGRQTGSFNNPNQLGYYALLVMCFIIISTNRIDIKITTIVPGIIISILFVLLSLSKASIVSAVGLLFFFLLNKSSNKQLKKKIIKFFMILSICMGFLYNNTNFIQENELFNSVQLRMKSFGNDSDDSLEGRGYDRIYNYPEYWLFGAGEGSYTRFNNQKMELHSTIGNIQVSYGLIGTILFILLIFISLKHDNYKSWYIIIFLMMYGLTHNGIRNSLFWILIALISSSKVRKGKVINE